MLALSFYKTSTKHIIHVLSFFVDALYKAMVDLHSIGNLKAVPNPSGLDGIWNPKDGWSMSHMVYKINNFSQSISSLALLPFHKNQLYFVLKLMLFGNIKDWGKDEYCIELLFQWSHWTFCREKWNQCQFQWTSWQAQNELLQNNKSSSYI